MSIALMTAVWALELAPSDKLVLLALADNANDEGACWPSMATLVTKTSLAERTVQGCIRNLQRAGLVSVFENAGRSNTYHVTPAAAAPPQNLHPRSTCTPPPQRLHPTPAVAAPTPAAAAPRTIIEPSREPSGNRHVPRAREAEVILGDDFEQFLVTTYPKSSHRQDPITALKSAQCLIGMRKATEDDLRRRLAGFRAFADSGGYSGPEKVPSIQRWFQVHQQGEPYWSKEWAALPSKAQRQQDANIDAGLEWLRQSGAA